MKTKYPRSNDEIWIDSAEDMPWIKNIAIPFDKDQMYLIERLEANKAIENVMITLTEMERSIISLRFGLKDGYSLTLKETGRAINRTAERVRQIEASALRKLRSPDRIGKLEGFI